MLAVEYITSTEIKYQDQLRIVPSAMFVALQSQSLANYWSYQLQKESARIIAFEHDTYCSKLNVLLCSLLFVSELCKVPLSF